jgi:hypothetical protein
VPTKSEPPKRLSKATSVGISSRAESRVARFSGSSPAAKCTRGLGDSSRDEQGAGIDAVTHISLSRAWNRAAYLCRYSGIGREIPFSCFLTISGVIPRCSASFASCVRGGAPAGSGPWTETYLGGFELQLEVNAQPAWIASTPKPWRRTSPRSSEPYDESWPPWSSEASSVTPETAAPDGRTCCSMHRQVLVQRGRGF